MPSHPNQSRRPTPPKKHLSPRQLARLLGERQDAISELRRWREMDMRALQTIVEGMGGQLKLEAVFPEGTVEIGRFRQPPEPKAPAASPYKSVGSSKGQARWLGIDFSGDIEMFDPENEYSRVWIAEIVEHRRKLHLERLYRPQELSGTGHPFQRLIERLQQKDYCAAGIDAPFSIPAEFMPQGGHDGLLALVKQLPHPNRPFPDAQTFIGAVLNGRELPVTRPLRATEREWRARRLDMKSPLLTGPNSSAPMTVACLTLVNALQRELWPWSDYRAGILVEAYPPAQLKTWRLPYRSYSYDGGRAKANRQAINEDLEERLDFGSCASVLKWSANAINAVLSAFAAIAVSRSAVRPPPSEYPRDEGWIAVHA
jgi:hypothetical protein